MSPLPNALLIWSSDLPICLPIVLDNQGVAVPSVAPPIKPITAPLPIPDKVISPSSSGDVKTS